MTKFERIKYCANMVKHIWNATSAPRYQVTIMKFSTDQAANDWQKLIVKSFKLMEKKYVK